MSETYFIEYKNTEIEISPEGRDKILLMVGNKHLLLSPGEAETLAQMLSDAAVGKDYDGYEEYEKDPVEEEAWEILDGDLGERMW